MKKIILMLTVWFVVGFSFAQCLTIADLTPIFEKDFDQQNQYLTSKGYKLNENSFDPESFGWDWKNAKNGHYVNIKMKDKDVYAIQYRLLSDVDCFKTLFNEAAAQKFNLDHIKITASTNYTYYKNDQYGLEVAMWNSDGKSFFQFNLANLKYFEAIKHQWDSY